MIIENQYFDGNVKSLGYETSAGKSTVGIINPGEYEFNTALKEIMHVIEGTLSVLLPNKTNWELIPAGRSFEVAANASFKVKAAVQTAYLCQYRNS
ncbi:pyrimidine/purine nucleoside phosphorylase [Pedobacter nototheniae]|uniref:pyrimidine/purine nucleoside phosphorylase n=1 Tax=Pedobacter nototheniae TaxID=2488994 RepID=UPI00292EBB80|nr:pyrimidine/purine nucleoside phosphorylase [Pedobacter nototheniae]